MFFKKKSAPEKLNICLTTRVFPLSQQTSEYGYLWPVAQGLVRAGHKLTVITTQRGQKEDFIHKDGIDIHYVNPRIERRSNYTVEVRKKFKELHDKNKFDIIHSMDEIGVAISVRKNIYKVASAFDIRATQVAQLFAIKAMSRESLRSIIRTDFVMAYKFLRTYFGKDKKLLNSADGVFVSSPHERIVLERYYYYPDARIYTIPYGVRFNSEIKPAMVEELMLKNNITLDNQCIVTISDMTDIEDLKNLLKSFQRVAIKKPDARLIILGDGPSKHELEYEVLSLALGNKVILTGAVNDDEINHYVSLAQVFVNLSSRSSGFEPSLLLAMSQGKTVIGSEVSALSSIVEDGIDGFLVRPADIQGIAQLFLDIFRGQLNTQEIGKRASKKVNDLFDTEKLVLNTIDAYKQILSST